MKIRDYNWPAYRVFYFGASGTGKNTRFLPGLIKEAKKSRWVFVFDHKGEFSFKLGGRLCHSKEQLFHETAHGKWVFFNYNHMYPGDRAAGLRFFANFVYSLGLEKNCQGRKIFVADEIQESAGPHDQPFDLITLLDDGRSLRVDSMLIAQGPNGVHTKVRGQATEIFCFRQADKNSTDFLKGVGFDENTIMQLRPGEWLWRNLNSGQAAKGGKAFRLNREGIPDGGTALPG